MRPPPRVRRRSCDAAGDWPDHLPPLLRRIYAARGATSLALAQPRLAHLLPPDGLSNLDAASALLAQAIAEDRHIVVVGDFDCDGATACALGVRGLRLLGARRVSYAVPNRMVHGYGLSPALVEELAALQPELLVTVDHGIACHAGVAAAKARGWRVLVTDHHLPGERLPPADAIVDPNLPGDAFPSKALAGVGVMFYVLLALRRRLREQGTFAGEAPDLGALLDLVAVGTVADLVPLDANNRALVGAGLRRLRAGQGCAGLRALIEVSRRDASRLTAADIGYAIGPRLNAAGRLEDMALGIECLLADDPARARDIAETLDRLNGERRAVQQQMTDEAERALARVAVGAGALPPALCLFDPEWHPGVVGLVASKLKERLHRPTIAFAPAESGAALLRGSARSVPGFHIRDALAQIDARHPGLIERFGGHAMAAGLSLRREALEAFHAAFERCAAEALTPELLQAELLSDGELAAEEFCRASAEWLRDGGPWGQGFPEPQFDGEFDVVDARPVGERHLRLALGCAGLRLNAIEFGGWDGGRPPPRVRVVYRLEPDDYRGGDAFQLVVIHRQPA
ncbi:single-stranded-DNA-specific exonuclease RecJ [Vulcaniibacterium tengchongense]|uniref:Single-stranded-DNA-specific exonuclease RecJ n=1 Tax=Vulcaniibacterium tengchongense TaxID=1273429 RepID=A0A3N4VP31_9GAMM|nr:single-stranded-DNA-specific exonuclease RecJ [Vulcaniibacterium tengchongense]RPE81619.1 exonuclease RecJ [Vulcaniibacterium tengchongense]